MADVLYHKQGLFGRTMELHVAPEGLTLVGAAGQGSTEYATMSDITKITVLKRGRKADLTVSFGSIRPAWSLRSLSTISAEWADALIKEEMMVRDKRERPEFSRRVPADKLAGICAEIAKAGDEHAIVDIVDFLLVQGVMHDASDVHFDPYGENVAVRFRLNGVLQDMLSLDSGMKHRLTTRLKVVSKLATFRKGVAQEGRAALRIGERTVDLRFSSIPTIHGEKVAVRIFDPAKSIFEISELGMTSEMLSSFQKILMQPQGLVLLTGPAGSGKTTTMYAALNYLRANRKNLSSIATVEDPVEYDLQVVNQTQVNNAMGLTFGNALRTVLRQDPEVIMIGEIRDRETAEIAVQAGLTGHMILSTVHARSAAGVPYRMVDLGVEPFLLTSSLSAVLSQRLVRTVCTACAEPHQPTAEEIERFRINKDDRFVLGRGCQQCGGTGYAGRTAIFQLVQFSDAMRDLVMARGSLVEMEEQMEREGIQRICQDGLVKAKAGITTLEELMRVLG